MGFPLVFTIHFWGPPWPLGPLEALRHAGLGLWLHDAQALKKVTHKRGNLVAFKRWKGVPQTIGKPEEMAIRDIGIEMGVPPNHPF